VMQHFRKRLKALERSRSLKRGPEVVLVKRDAVTGQWIAATEDGMKPSMPIVLFYSLDDPYLKMFPDNPPRVLDVTAQR
jgi:hypothetical protein